MFPIREALARLRSGSRFSAELTTVLTNFRLPVSELETPAFRKAWLACMTQQSYVEWPRFHVLNYRHAPRLWIYRNYMDVVALAAMPAYFKMVRILIP